MSRQPIDAALATAVGMENARRAAQDRARADRARLRPRRAAAPEARRCSTGSPSATTLPVPQGMVEIEFDAIWKQFEDERRGAPRAGQPAKPSRAPSETRADEEKLKAEYRAIAERRVRLGLLLSEVGRANNITVSAGGDQPRAFGEQARRFPGQERQVIEFYRKQPGACSTSSGRRSSRTRWSTSSSSSPR